MSRNRRYSSVAVFVAILFFVSCSGKEPEAPPKAETAKAEPSPPAAAAPAATDAPTAADSKSSPPSSPQPPAKPGAAAGKDAAGTLKDFSPVTPPASGPAQSKPVPAVPQAPPPAPAPAPTPATEQPQAPAPQPENKPTPSAPPASTTPKDVVILKASLGGVRFEHKQHSQTRKIACETCHHSSRMEKPASTPQQACGLCHTPVAAAPMKTKLQAAFHNATATAGTCIDCHKAGNASGKAAPVKCLDCHKRENK